MRIYQDQEQIHKLFKKGNDKHSGLKKFYKFIKQPFHKNDHIIEQIN